MTAADEARRLAEEFAEPQWAAAADTVISLVAAMRGDEQKAERLAARAETVAEPAGREHHDGVRPVRQGAGRARHRPPQRRVRIRRATVRSGRLGIPPRDLILADRGSRRGCACTSTGSMPRGHGWRRSRRSPVTQPGAWIALGLRSCPRAGRRAGRGGRALRRGTGERPDTVAVSAREDPARIRPVAETSATCRRVAGCPACCARHLRRAWMRTVERAGAARVARVGRAQPASRPGGARSANRAGAADRPARGRGPVEPRDRPATVPLASHDQHAPVPGVPEARDHLARLS